MSSQEKRQRQYAIRKQFANENLNLVIANFGAEDNYLSSVCYPLERENYEIR